MCSRRRDTEPIETSAVPGCFRAGGMASSQSQACTVPYGKEKVFMSFIRMSYLVFSWFLLNLVRIDALMSIHKCQMTEKHDFSNVLVKYH